VTCDPKKQPIFSVIIPAHNEEAHILTTIATILNQTEKNYEIIVINDDSSDNTQKYVEDYIKRIKEINIKLINIKKGSAAGTRNVGIMAATGKYVVFQDADCFADPNLLNNALKILEDLDIDGVATRTTNVPPTNWIQHAVAIQRAMRWENTYKSPAIKFLDKNSGINVAIMKREVVKKLNGFDESIFYYEDNDLTRRFFEEGHTAVFAPDVIQYHNDPISLLESLGQCKSIAKGFHIRIKQGKYLTFFEWVSLFSGIITPINFLSFLAILITGYSQTKDLKGSFYLGVMWELRSLAKLYYFLTRWKV